MKHGIKPLILACLVLGLYVPAHGALYIDSVPNVCGPPDWVDWLARAQTDTAACAFTNIGAGTFEVKWTIDWGGANWTYDARAWAADTLVLVGDLYDAADRDDLNTFWYLAPADQTCALGQIWIRQDDGGPSQFESMLLPEPASIAVWSLIGLSWAGLAVWRRRRQTAELAGLSGRMTNRPSRTPWLEENRSAIVQMIERGRQHVK